jgi:hypothetical protein
VAFGNSQLTANGQQRFIADCRGNAGAMSVGRNWVAPINAGQAVAESPKVWLRR